MGIFFYYNDKLHKEGTPVINADNRSLRYGDGLFETIKLINGHLILGDHHFERLFSGMRILQFDHPAHFTAAYLTEKINTLSKNNEHMGAARIRLTVFRGNGGLYDPENHLPNYIIETWQISNEVKLNTNGLVVGVYPYAKKSCDIFSNIKTNNALPYAMAALYSKKNKLNDAFVLNNNNRICDTTIANIFIIKDGIVYTPPLSEGCIAGITRKWLLENLPKADFQVIEKVLTVEEVKNADELFTTNSIKDINWVRHFQDKEYSNQITEKIHGYFIKSVY